MAIEGLPGGDFTSTSAAPLHSERRSCRSCSRPFVVARLRRNRDVVALVKVAAGYLRDRSVRDSELDLDPLEIFPSLGATRLAGPLDQLRPAAVFHGHAHRGTLRGAPRGRVPVYNVALPVLRKLEKPCGYFMLDL